LHILIVLDTMSKQMING